MAAANVPDESAMDRATTDDPVVYWNENVADENLEVVLVDKMLEAVDLYHSVDQHPILRKTEKKNVLRYTESVVFNYLPIFRSISSLFL